MTPGRLSPASAARIRIKGSTCAIPSAGAGDGEVLLNGVNVAASHIWLEGLTPRNVTTRSAALVSVNSPTNVILTRCSFLNNLDAVVLSGACSNWYIADNTIVGTTPAGTTAPASYTGEGVDLRTTSGHTVAYNSITNVADAISEPHTNVDIFGNDIFDTADDGIEADNGRANVRMWGNRIPQRRAQRHQLSAADLRPGRTDLGTRRHER